MREASWISQEVVHWDVYMFTCGGKADNEQNETASYGLQMSTTDFLSRTAVRS